jgi:ABC-type antimicrobial peptide transport system permease subunit
MEWNIESDRVFIDSVIVNSIYKFDEHPSLFLTYLANSIEKNDRATPYSFVSAGPFFNNTKVDPNDIIINSWLAEDLGAREGDSVLMKYYSIGPLRQLVENEKWFIVQNIVPLADKYADRGLMPTLPGLSDAGSCRDWEAGIPIDLEKIRDKDEDYWDVWKGTPKAFVSYYDGKKIWENRFGACTLIRLNAADYERSEISQNILKYHGPADLGFQLRNLKKIGLEAASGGVDFSELFFGMSFFLLIASVTLLALLFNIHLENRMSQYGTLKALGYSNRLVQKLILSETAIVVFFGALLGSLLAIWYNRLIFKALNSVWSAIVRTSVLAEDIRYSTILLGIVVSFVLVFITVFFNIRKKLKTETIHLQRGQNKRRGKYFTGILKVSAWISLIVSCALIVREFMAATGLNAGIFFLSGGLTLISFILFSSGIMFRENDGLNLDLSMSELAWRNLQRNRARSLRIIILFALGTFVIVSTGLNRKDLYSDAMNKSSGTGGFLFYGETTMPVLHDLNNSSTKADLDISEEINFVQMRKSEGDDASCLNLNRISQPRILGIPPEQLNGRFSFINTSEEFDQAEDWQALKLKLPGGVVPAIADQTVIQWGLGMKVGDTLVYTDEYGNEMLVRLIGGLANSIFQGNILIDEDIFLEHFPSSSGIHVFLIDTKSESREEIEAGLVRSFRNTGLDIVYTADRLAEFNSVENTYLSIFLLLGGLGMILGTVGLGLSLVRNIQDRLQELGILRAVGFGKEMILKMLTREHIILLGLGTLIGTAGAFVATIPSVFSEFIDASWQTALIIVFMIIINGLIWIYLIGRVSLGKDLVGSLRAE